MLRTMYVAHVYRAYMCTRTCAHSYTHVTRMLGMYSCMVMVTGTSTTHIHTYMYILHVYMSCEASCIFISYVRIQETSSTCSTYVEEGCIVPHNKPRYRYNLKLPVVYSFLYFHFHAAQTHLAQAHSSNSNSFHQRSY